jgi:hypothetical protein
MASKIEFKLINVVPHRAMRDKGHAKFAIYEDGEQVNWLWMTNDDIKANIQEYPDQRESLIQGLI